MRFTIRHMPLPYGEVWTRLSEYFRASMQKIGIGVTMETTDAGGHAAKMANWDYETSANFVYQVGDANIGMEQYFASENIRKVAFNNVGGYQNERVDELLRKRVTPSILPSGRSCCPSSSRSRWTTCLIYISSR